MSEVKFIVRDAHRTVSSTWHGSCADRAVAALSADPMTIEELEVAIGRYMKPSGDGRCFRCFGGSLDDEPYDAGLVVIDLAARLIAVESSYSSPSRKGTVRYHNGECATNTPIRYHLADEWLVTSDIENWRHLAEKRRRERAAHPPLDARAVLFGRPLVEFLAAECFAAFARRGELAQATRAKWIANSKERALRWPDVVRKDPKYIIASHDGSVRLRDPETMTLEELAPSTSPGQERYASPFYDALKDIHVAWLMTPRADLRGEIPREVLLARHDHISSDLDSRCEQWSRLDFCPRGLDTTSHAFQFGGFGTHELVKYYDLVRELLWSGWERLTGLAQSPNSSQRLESLMPGDFLTAEVPRLEQVRDEWLNTPDPECHFRTPRSVIDRERQRLPEGISGHEAMVDPDCPCCQMLADMPGPTFWHLDGSGMDWGEFAFDIYHRTREEWEAEQRDYEEFSRKCDASDAERRRLGVDHPAEGQHPAGSVWSSSYSIDDSPNVPLGIRLFGIGGHLAELITDLREPPKRREQMESCESLGIIDPQPLIDQLNRDFGNLREVLTGAEAALSASLVEPVLDHFAETLEAVAAERPDLNPKCGALFAKLKNFLTPPNPERPELFPDDGVPF